MIYRHTITRPGTRSTTEPEVFKISLPYLPGIDLDSRHDETTPRDRTVKGRKWRGKDLLLTNTYKRGPQL